MSMNLAAIFLDGRQNDIQLLIWNIHNMIPCSAGINLTEELSYKNDQSGTNAYESLKMVLIDAEFYSESYEHHYISVWQKVSEICPNYYDT